MIGVIGLGLVGGSMAKALNQNTDHTVYGFDINQTVCQKAKLVNAIEDILTDDILAECDIVVLAIYPQATIDYVKSHAHLFKKGAIVLDTCGVKNYQRRLFTPMNTASQGQREEWLKEAADMIHKQFSS